MPPPNLPQRPNPQQLTLVSKWIDQSLTSGGLDLDNQNYLTRAEYEFASGNEDLAMEFLYAHILAAEPPASDELLSQAGWFALGPRPALVTRYAVGVDLQAAETLTDLKPIGVNQMGGAGGGGGGYGGGGYGGGERPSSGSKDRTLYELTGDFGEALVGEFSSRWSSGDMGTVFAKIVPRSSVPTAPGQFAGANYGGGNYGGGGYGGDASYGGGGYGGGQSGGNAGTEVRKEILPGSLATPGLIFIGTGSQAELLERAKERGVDGLFIFDVEATQNRRTRLVNNDTRLRVITIDGKAFGATKTLMNTEVERAKQRDSSNDEVGKNVERLFALFDKDAKLASLPPLKPEHARTRVRQLLVDKQAGPLSKLFETRLFLHLGLISLDEAAKVYQIIFQGNEGEALAHGTEADRKLVLQSLLPE
jgi:hypothetical protein